MPNTNEYKPMTELSTRSRYRASYTSAKVRNIERNQVQQYGRLLDLQKILNARSRCTAC